MRPARGRCLGQHFMRGRGTIEKAHHLLAFPRRFLELTAFLRLISVNNVSMRYGARILFEDVTTTFLPDGGMR